MFFNTQVAVPSAARVVRAISSPEGGEALLGGILIRNCFVCNSILEIDEAGPWFMYNLDYDTRYIRVLWGKYF